MSTKTILIADDEPTIVISLEYMLQQSGYDVQIARDGQEAIEAIARQIPNLLLLDIMMPRLSGYDVCQKIRESKEWRDIRIIMLSAKGREVEIAKGLALGADAYITKPFSSKELLEQIRAQLGEDAEE